MSEKVTLTCTMEDEDSGMYDETMTLPSKFVVCWRCRGRGVHDHGAFSNGISPEEFAEDPDFREDYFNGMYDVTCTECKGRRVLAEVEREYLNAEQQVFMTHWDESERAEAEYQSMCKAEREMGA